MITRVLTALALSLALAVVAAPTALACGDDHKEAAKTVPADAQTVTIKVQGMTCGDCANAIRNALLKLDGVYDAEVSHETGLALVKVDASKVDQARLDEAISKAGYKVESPQKG
jgi:copper chaperone